MLPDVLLHALGSRPDVVISLRVFHAILLSEFAVMVQDEFLNVIAIGGGIVGAEHWQTLVLLGQFSAQPRAVMPARSLGTVSEVGFHFLIDHPADVHHAVNLRAAGVVI